MEIDPIHSNEAKLTLDLAALEHAVREDLDRERGVQAWVRSRSRAERGLMILGVAGLVAGSTFLVAPRPDLYTYPRVRMLATLAWFLVAGGVATWIALRPIYLPRPPRGLVLAAAAFAILGPIVTALLPEVPMAHAPVHRVWPWAYGCFASGITAALVVLVISRAFDRGGAHAGGQIVLAAAAAGLAGTIALQLHCPINYPLHLLLGHATVPLGLILGAWFARRAT
jgi:hypothetical protein